MLRWPILLCLAACALGCGRAALARVAQPHADDVPPHIADVLDLGALPLPAEGELSSAQHDGLFTPGEWAVVRGRGLARSDARVFLGAHRLPVAGYVREGLLVRIPRGLSPRTMQTMRVETAHGRAERPLRYASHVVVSDVSGSRLRFVRMSPDAERLFDAPYDLPLPRVRKHVFSPDGGLLFAIEAHAENADGRYGLATVHVGAAEHPALLERLSLTLSDVPVDLVAAPLRGELFLLTRRELVVLSVQDPRAVRERGRIALPEGAAWSLAALAQDTRAAVLERERNELWLFDMTAPVPVLLQKLALPPAGTPRASIALLADRDDTRRLWLLQGPSLARLSQRVHTAIQRAEAPLDRARAALGWEREAAAAGDETPAHDDGTPAPRARLVALALARELSVERELSLPEAFVPLVARQGIDGRLLISGITSDAAHLVESLAGTGQGLAGLVGLVAGSVQFGRVIAVDPAEGGAETLAQGMAMFFDLDQLPDGQLVYSVLRPRVHALPPGLGVSWNIEALKTDAVRMRTLRWTFLLPPYVAPPLSVQ